METETSRRILLFLAGLLVWNYLDLKYARTLDYDGFSYLVDSQSGEKLKPKQLLDVVRLVEPTEDYVTSTNAIERLYDLEFNVNLLSALETDLDYSSADELALSGWPVADQEKCARDLKWVREQLTNNRNYSLLKGQLGMELSQLMDSFGRPQAGLLSGLVTWPGLYRRCREVTLNHNQVGTRYCWARMKFKWWPSSEPVRPKPRIRVGVCLPETCDTRSYGKHRQTIEWLIKLELNEFYRNSLELDSMFCLPDERSPVRQISLAGWIYIVLVTSWISLVLVSSMFLDKIRTRLMTAAKKPLQSNGTKGNKLRARSPAKRLRSPSRGDTSSSGIEDNSHQKSWHISILKVLESISIGNSLEQFIGANRLEQAEPSGRRIDLSSLNACKFLLALMILLGHTYYLSITFARSHQSKVQMAARETGNLIVSFGRLVDTFFLLFGLFASYTLLRKVPQVERLANWKIWLGYNLNVMMRLAPVMLPIYWYTKLLAPYACHGPWWDYGQHEHSLRGACHREPWWKSIPHFGFLGPIPGVACLPTAWFLVAYTQLSLIIPLVLICLCQLPSQKLKLLLVFFVCCVSGSNLIGKMSNQSTFKEETVGHFGALLVDLLEKFESLGTMATLGRAGGVLIGCYVGHLLRLYETGKIGEWPNWFRSKLTPWLVLVLNLAIFMLPVAGTKLTHLRANLTTFVATYLVSCFLWSIANAILLILTVSSLKRASLIRFLAHPFWRSANKLGLGIYLIHWEVLYTLILGYERGPSIDSELDIWMLFALATLITIPLAFCIHILFEAPLNALISLVQERRGTLQQLPESTKSKLLVSQIRVK